jgi:hypothetical protein
MLDAINSLAKALEQQQQAIKTVLTSLVAQINIGNKKQRLSFINIT